MTFSIIARCSRTGMLGGIATRPMAIGAKCPSLKAGIGGLVVHADGDSRQGPLGLRSLELGYSADKVLREIAESDGEDNMQWRKKAVVDKDGRTAVHTGSSNEEWKGTWWGKVSLRFGKRMTSEKTVAAMRSAFEESEDEALAERLVRALEAGRDAGGQVAGHHSAAMLVFFHQKSNDWVDVRADEHDEPIGELRRQYGLFIPLIPYYDSRPSNPSMPRDDDWRKQAGVKRGPR